MVTISAFVDGCSLGNPGYAGASAVLIAEKDGVEVKRTEVVTSAGDDITNNVAELMAVRLVMETLKGDCSVKVFTDSRNVIGWLTLGWKRKDPSIKALAEEIEQLSQRKNIIYHCEKVAGHAGVELNERADALAKQAAAEFKAYCAA